MMSKKKELVRLYTDILTCVSYVVVSERLKVCSLRGASERLSECMSELLQYFPYCRRKPKGTPCM